MEVNLRRVEPQDAGVEVGFELMYLRMIWEEKVEKRKKAVCLILFCFRVSVPRPICSGQRFRDHAVRLALCEPSEGLYWA